MRFSLSASEEIEKEANGRLYVHEVFEHNNLLDEVASNLVHNSTNTASPLHQGEVLKVLKNIFSENFANTYNNFYIFNVDNDGMPRFVASIAISEENREIIKRITN